MLIIVAQTIPGGQGAATLPGGTATPAAPAVPGQPASTGVQSMEMSAELVEEAAQAIPGLIEEVIDTNPSLIMSMLNREPGLMSNQSMPEVVDVTENNQTFQQEIMQEEFFWQAIQGNKEFQDWFANRANQAVERAL